MDEDCKYHLLYGTDICDTTLTTKTKKYIKQLMQLDKQAYGEKGKDCIYIGKQESYLDRFGYKKIKGKYHLLSDYGNVDSIIAIQYKDRIIGYINFLLLSDELYDEIINPNMTEYAIHPENRDDGITGKQVCQWSKEKNNIFILSIVIDKQFQNGEVIRLLTNSFVSYIKEKSKEYPITSITCDTVSEHGTKIMKLFWCIPIYKNKQELILPAPESDLSQYGVHVLRSKGYNIHRLLQYGVRL